MRASLKAAALIGAGLCVIASAIPAQTLRKVADANKITVSYREASIPFSYLVAPGKPVGFAADLTDEIVADIRKTLNKPDLEVAWIPVTGTNRIPMLVDGTYDLECGSTTNTAARGNDVAFAISHFYAGTRVMVRKDSRIKDYRGLAKKTVATTAGSTNEKVIRKYGEDNRIDFQVVFGKDYRDAFELVEHGAADALALDDVLLYGLIATAEDPSMFNVIGAMLQVEPYGCMLRKDDPGFKQLVDGTITRLMRTGEFTKLYAKWFESPIPPRGAILGMPMSEPLKNNLVARSDKPAM